MGIDVYMRWKGQTEQEKQAQYTGFSIVSGHIGYLREAYHGPPYATEALVPDAFDKDIQIPAATLRERLPAALQACSERYAGSPGDLLKQALKSYEDFVALAAQKEAETGLAVTIHVSA